MPAINLTSNVKDNLDFIMHVSKESGQPVQHCYQCGKCTAGCPVAFAMDYPPNRIIRMVQLGLKEHVLKSQAIWLCAYCSTCTSRCPRNVNLARVMDCLRGMARREGIQLEGRAKKIALFYDCFLDTVKRNGKLYELGMMLNYNLKTGHFFKDAGTGLAMFTKGKIKLIPTKNENYKDLAQIFERIEEMEEKC
ncbi:4Fe-4S dicluster domain-containing protein [Desulfallas sp. Bu1-1]|jgi:heterodisulfide reductase subunit C|uniref:4Fe-4S dicluster domain-containing protein n=1 Tax=Desulfallas sp. Bu1-1 TaxID=2787620 RepID=UPI00189DA547|nr:4Fe-4S dicluster domain-containing protein [Desulfallas sp. Bu1-1]MBF7084648.1 4Fe-4S dicluster domain-containing protein [Desulfallas sp. Bu1-1]